jgi:hypothetical protein
LSFDIGRTRFGLCLVFIEDIARNVECQISNGKWKIPSSEAKTRVFGVKLRMESEANQIEQSLNRILAAVEKPNHKSWIEVFSALLLSFATLADAWCVYQSKVWMGVQRSQGSAANVEDEDASMNKLQAFQIRGLETTLFVRFAEAKGAGDERLARFLADRLSPSSKEALLAWWEANPRDNPNAPRTPFHMPQYKQPQLDEAAKHEQLAQEHQDLARQANRNADTYLLLTVVFTSVLFFGGISGTFESYRLRQSMLCVAFGLFLITFVVLTMMPIHWRGLF